MQGENEKQYQLQPQQSPHKEEERFIVEKLPYLFDQNRVQPVGVECHFFHLLLHLSGGYAHK
jgi:hypothetical protein